MRKKIIYGIITFFFSFTILTIIFSINGLLNKQFIIKGDIYAQFFPLLNYLKGIFNGSNSLFYSFYKNLGGTMFGTFFYYLSSPFNLFAIYIKNENLSLFFMRLVIFKMSFCSLSMYIYMTYKYKTSNFLIVTFSICYGLMGYSINFFVNIMWLDVVIMAPIVLMGLDKLINKESPTLYIVSLFISVFCNYYISYMLCIFCVIYFIYEVLLKYDNRRDRLLTTKRFLVISLFTGMMCSFFLIPCFIESKNYFRSLNLNEILNFNYNIFNLFSKTFIGSANFNDLLNYSSINLYCGIIILPLVYLYLINGDISKKNRRLTLFFIVFMILPCFIFPLNYMWHLFSNPSFYSYRYSFLLCFFLLNIAYNSYINLNIKKINFTPFFLVYFVISIYFVLISFTGYYNFLNFNNIFLSFLFLMIYSLILKKCTKNKSGILCLIIFIEIILNLVMIFNNKIVFSKRNLVDNDYINIVNEYKNDRMEFTDFLTFNDSVLMEYYGINNFLSTNNNRVMRFFTQMSLKQKFYNQNIYNYKKGQYILDSLIGLRYVVSSYKIDNYILIDKTIINESDAYIFENPNSLGLGYMIADECNHIMFDFKYDENVFNCLFDINTEYYAEYKIERQNDEYTAVIKNPTGFYLYYPGIVNTNINFDGDVISYSNDFIYIDNNKKDYIFHFNVEDIDYDKMKIYYFNFERFKSQVSKIINEKFNYKIINNRIVGNINTDGGILMVTIPYEKGFVIKVDGTIVSYKEVLDTFIGIDLDAGYHDISIEYSQPYLKTGVCISLLSFVLLLVYIKSDKKLY